MTLNSSVAELDRASVLHPFTNLKDFANGTLGDPTIIETAKGVKIKDSTGREFIDGFGGLYCVNVGYGRTEVADAITRQANNRLTSDELAAEVNLSSTAVQRRLKRLRTEGVIKADVSVIEPKAVGRHISMFVLVSLERERADIVDRFKESIRATPEVMNGYYVTGESDFALVVTAKDMEDYEKFTRRFFYENPDIKGFKTMVIMDRVKVGFSIPVSVADDPA